jgi:hypothetical protein
VDRKLAIVGIAGMVLFLGLSAWFDLSGHREHTPIPHPTSTSTSTSTATAAPTTQPPSGVVDRNRNDRRGPSWSPRDLVGKDGHPLTLGNVVPGAFGPVRAGMSIADAVNTGFIERDPTNRGGGCEGSYWRWKGQLSEGLDIIVGPDKKVASLGMTKDGLETAEGISIGNSYGALKKTYGDRLQGPERMDYGQAGTFLRDGNDWIGFGMDNKPGQLADSSRIAFIEVTSGNRPGLIRDGC